MRTCIENPLCPLCFVDDCYLINVGFSLVHNLSSPYCVFYYFFWFLLLLTKPLSHTHYASAYSNSRGVRFFSKYSLEFKFIYVSIEINYFLWNHTLNIYIMIVPIKPMTWCSILGNLPNQTSRSSNPWRRQTWESKSCHYLYTWWSIASNRHESGTPILFSPIHPQPMSIREQKAWYWLIGLG